MRIKSLFAAMILCVSIVSPNYTVAKYKDTNSEEFLWEILHKEAPNDYVAAGIMGFFWRESFYRSDAVTYWQIDMKDIGEDPCDEFTKMLDSADKKEFVSAIQAEGGYGLGQWYAETYLKSLYDFCKGYGTSFADAEMQCKFTVHMCVNDPKVWETLKDAKNAYEAGRIIGYLHDGSSVGAETIGAKANMIYRDHCK